MSCVELILLYSLSYLYTVTFLNASSSSSVTPMVLPAWELPSLQHTGHIHLLQDTKSAWPAALMMPSCLWKANTCPGHSVLQLLEGRVPSASQSCSLESGRYMCSRIGVDGLCQTKAFSSSNMWALQVVPSVLPKYSFSCLTLLCASVLEKGTEQRGHGRDTPLTSEGWPGVALFF